MVALPHSSPLAHCPQTVSIAIYTILPRPCGGGPARRLDGGPQSTPLGNTQSTHDAVIQTSSGCITPLGWMHYPILHKDANRRPHAPRTRHQARYPPSYPALAAAALLGGSMAVRNRPRWETRNQHMTQWFEHRVVALPHPPMASLPHRSLGFWFRATPPQEPW